MPKSAARPSKPRAFHQPTLPRPPSQPALTVDQGNPRVTQISQAVLSALRHFHADSGVMLCKAMLSLNYPHPANRALRVLFITGSICNSPSVNKAYHFLLSSIGNVPCCWRQSSAGTFAHDIYPLFHSPRSIGTIFPPSNTSPDLFAVLPTPFSYIAFPSQT